jgi:hypothetical protein
LKSPRSTETPLLPGFIGILLQGCINSKQSGACSAPKQRPGSESLNNMFLSFWLRSLSVMDFYLTRIRRPHCFVARRKRSRRNWTIEALEDRALLSTITVTSVLDSVDATDGVTTLREAILAANDKPGYDTIVFNIDGGGVHTIQPMSALPQILDSVTIDGSTQPGYAGTPVIELDGSLAGLSANGLHILAGNTTIRGLAINRFARDGIYLQNRDGNVIVGNFIGTDATGTVSLGNRVAGATD